ncbi:helix-turn-helix domain-containing protein [Saliphagus sp. LR7]|uniref:winged helix-turn-helix domain-containing protein n=1 Tax=Saliphagus sp. LR7 TaxID=2282654 RepID=UPI000DF78624|nr:helix-turn-helix domain-containing protein [Saliphagus sp. LR7]
MVRDLPSSEGPPALQTVLDALGDPECRAILSEATEPMTATELAETCDISQSTVYRKLDLLTEASLVDERTGVGSEGGRISQYERDMTDVSVSIDETGEFSIELDRPSRHADERLAEMWSEMGDEL